MKTDSTPSQRCPTLSGTLLLLLLPPLTLAQLPKPFPPPLNLRLEKAYLALQALKHSITSDPTNLTADWCGPHVCSYTGVFCAPPPDDPSSVTVAGLDLNHADLAGTLPEDLGHLSDLALLHLNSNRFWGSLPESLRYLPLLYELDVSSNRLDGPFPSVVLRLPSLKYLDIRYNLFSGPVPPQLFDLKLDALFLNDNRFRFSLPDNIGKSTVSVLVLANTALSGCIPRSIGDMAETLEQLVLLNTGLDSCLPPEIGKLRRLTVFDVSSNRLVGPLPEEMGAMEMLEEIDVSHNMLSGEVPEAVCRLPRLENFTYSDNYFCSKPQRCVEVGRVDGGGKNCILQGPGQRPEAECKEFLSKPLHCEEYRCLRPLPLPWP